jgi:hypothetical protein
MSGILPALNLQTLLDIGLDRRDGYQPACADSEIWQVTLQELVDRIPRHPKGGGDLVDA